MHTLPAEAEDNSGKSQLIHRLSTESYLERETGILPQLAWRQKTSAVDMVSKTITVCSDDDTSLYQHIKYLKRFSQRTANNNMTTTERCPVIARIEVLCVIINNNNKYSTLIILSPRILLIWFCLFPSFPSRSSTTRCRGDFRIVSPLSTVATRCLCWQVRTTAPMWRKGAKVSIIVVF